MMLYSVAGGSLDPWAQPQMIRFGLGLCVMFAVAMIDIRFWRATAPLAYLVSLMLLVYVEFFGYVGMGAQRWIDLGFIVLQPSEMMKIGLVLLLAFYYAWLDPAKVSRPLWVVPPLIAILAPVALVLTQPDLGTSIMLLAGGGAMMFLAGVSLWYFGAAIAAAAGLVTVVLKSRGTDWQLLRDYQFSRIDTFLDPGKDPLGTGYHITQAKIALGSGGLSGRGYMQGTQSRLNFLPEKHTDFIFTTLAEEFGFAGSIALLILYTLIVAFCVASAISNRDRFGALRHGGDRRHLLSVLRGEHEHGDGPDAGGRRAAAAGLLRRLGHAGAARRLRPRAKRACAPAPRGRLSAAAPRSVNSFR